ncbi:hypothetical protein [Mycolicibacterium lacusdiani]|uniref:hypothetical protein n=1 Tax=Mycolicibacterium lacusdiani TaxID=2895283 RepID=UPI001F420234|nr:hypothetical protein [Mycolicibacterium lacusdiani]
MALTGVTTIASWNRIGALAVALGVGLTVADPTGIAWASPEDTETSDVVVGTDVGAEGEPTPDDPAIPAQPPDGSSTGATAEVGPESSPPVVVSSTGGANTTINGESAPDETTMALDDDAAADPGPPAQSEVPPAEAPADSVVVVVPTVTSPIDADQPVVDGSEFAASDSSRRSAGRTDVGWLPAPAAADTVMVEVDATPARRAPANSSPTGRSAGEPPTVVAARPSAEEPVTPASAVLAFAARAGIALLAPLAGFGNGTPTAPPMAWTVLAWVRREFDDAIDALLAERDRATASGDALIVLTAETQEPHAAGRTTVITSVADATESNAHVAVLDGGTGAVVGEPLVLVGQRVVAVAFASDDTRIVVAAYGDESRITRLVVADAATGDPVGEGATVDGWPGGFGVVSGGALAAVVAIADDATTGSQAATVLTVDTDTGEGVGDVVTVADQSVVDVLVVADVDRAVVTTEATDSETGTFVTTVTVVDLLGPDRLASVTVDGSAESTSMSVDGSTIAVSTSTRDVGTGALRTGVTSIDVRTGELA